LKALSQKPKKPAIFPDLWYKAIVKKQADQEKMRIAVIQQINKALTRLDKKYHWDEVYLFGSVAQKGKFRRNSDIDIAVRGLDKLEHYAFIGEISDLLNKRVDVILLEECHFADSIRERGIKWSRKSKL
jgi:predicted nucleotidyltransferase